MKASDIKIEVRKRIIIELKDAIRMLKDPVLLPMSFEGKDYKIVIKYIVSPECLEDKK